MASATVTYAKTVPPLPPIQPGPRLRKLAQDILQVAAELGDANPGGTAVSIVLDDVAKTLTVAGGSLAASRVIPAG